MKKSSDTSILENIAEDKISFELQKYDLFVAKPKSDRSGTDLLVFTEIADSVKFCRIQSKGRSLEHSDRSSIEIPYFHVDAFTTEAGHGNPAGVCAISMFAVKKVSYHIHSLTSQALKFTL